VLSEAGVRVPELQHARRLADVFARWRAYQFLAWLALPFAFYLVPVVLGYAWNAVGDHHNILNPPQGYIGRMPDQRVTVESWGASVVDVPFHARLSRYLRDGQLPLWNPYQGLGQPFAAQGEESPYSPFAIARAVLPYSASNLVTFGVYYLSAVSLYLFLRGLGVSEKAALFGGVAYVVSGALSLHLSRANFADQAAIVPMLFWAVARAARQRTTLAYAALVGVAALHATGGLIQIAMLSAILAVLFGLMYSRWLATSLRAWLRDALVLLGAFGLGNALVAFYLLPLLDAMVSTFNKDIPSLALFVPIGLGNVVGFFFPLLLGYAFTRTWSAPPAIVDWDNLMAFTGLAILLIAVFGLTVARWSSALQRRAYWFFLATGVFLLFRYIGAPPAQVVNYLPIIGRQSPKHATEVIAFCFVVAAAFALHGVRSWNWGRGRWLGLGIGLYTLAVVGKLIEGAGFTTTHRVEIDWGVAIPSILATAYLTALLVGGLWLAHRWRGLSTDATVTLLTTLAIAELVAYIPLGNASVKFLAERLVLSTLIVGCGVLLCWGRSWSAAGLFAVTLVGYATILVRPDVGLPRAFDLDQPPAFLTWLQADEGQAFRSFGIAPDHSSIGPVQDISAVGPLAPQEYAQFVHLVSTPKVNDDYATTTHFMLYGPWSFGLDQYAQMKPIFDWIGVRYLVLDRDYFNPRLTVPNESGESMPTDGPWGWGPRTDNQALLEAVPDVRQAYVDLRSVVLESGSARPKAEFWTGAEVYDTQEALLANLREQPASILGPPKLERALLKGVQVGAPEDASQVPATVQVYDPNRVRVSVDAPDAGVLVLKDSYFPGWQASANGVPLDVLRVEGLVRGVLLPGAGHYDVEFRYAPSSFTRGLWVSGLSLALVAIAVAWAVVRGRREPPWWVLAGGCALVLVMLALSSQAYFGRP
jgi:hypothetical protein